MSEEDMTSDELFAIADRLTDLARVLLRRELVGTHAGWCACGVEMVFTAEGLRTHTSAHIDGE